MKQPLGFEVCDANGIPLACRLNKALYGLKYASRAWFEKLRYFLVQQLKFQSSKVVSGCLFMLVYVDDIIVNGDDCSELEKVIQCLNEKFWLKDLVKVCLRTIGTCQHGKCQAGKHLNGKFSYLTVVAGSPLGDGTFYRQIVGSFQYLCLTRPDIAFAINKVSQYMHQPYDGHWTAVKQILRYIRGTVTHGLVFQLSSVSLTGFSDSDWASSLEDGQSTLGFCLYLGDNLIGWASKK
ncbi:Retrovirus-related Pol polyprotein from transposon TNT 1-94 [Gossypium australe]|uniref:Retrovirus-related Pol polyprotein from transposon TNT 1-94 n=1 Tax=Gossypium australe TaxID=47621 RepID=A0A5B6W731_9ROSI|nr:Retrovirus-related Pol polyprotein from transposon TNT 1-94 [Gossypium australe]